MRFKQHPYQDLIIQHILDVPRCNVHAGMGSGKSVSTLTAIDLLLATDAIEGPVLILAPLRVANFTWPAEVAKWSHLKHLRASVVTGNVKQRQDALEKPADIYVTNYESIPWLVEQYRKKPWPFQMIVADEVTKLKSYRSRKGSKRARALAEVAHESTRWVGLTGTPSPNGLMDLWGQCWFVDKGASLGKSFTAFRDRWFQSDYMGYSWQPMPGADRDISARLAPYTISIRPEDWFDLDEPVVRQIQVQLPPQVAPQYREMEKEMLLEMAQDEVIVATHAATKTMKLRQIANGFVQNTETGTVTDLHDEKLQALEELIEESGGEPILIAYAFIHDRDRIVERFGAEVFGDDPTTVDRWNAGRIPLLLAHPASCGHGLNLADGGRTLVFFGVDWNLEQHDQIIERVGPMRQKQAGHDRSVLIYYILAEDTIDGVILERLHSKTSVQQALLAYMALKESQ